MSNKFLQIDPGRIRVARPGYDVDAATEEQMAFDSSWPYFHDLIASGITPPVTLTSSLQIDFPTQTYIPLVRIRLAADLDENSVNLYCAPAAKWIVGGNSKSGSLFDVEVFRNKFIIRGVQRGGFINYGAPTGYASDHSFARRFYYMVYGLPFIEGI